MFLTLKHALHAGMVATMAIPTGLMASDVSVSVPSDFSKSVLSAVDAGKTNTLVSPLSVELLIALARAGLEPKSMDMNFPETVSLSHAVWVDNDVELESAAATSLTESWGAKTHKADLASDGMSLINDWVKKSTNGLIPKLFDSPLTNANVAVTTAMYFRDAWSAPFSAAKTKDQPFTLEDGEQVSAPFMTSSETFPSWTTEEGLFAVMSFDAGGYLLLHLPTEAEEGQPPAADDTGTSAENPATPVAGPGDDDGQEVVPFDPDRTAEMDTEVAPEGSSDVPETDEPAKVDTKPEPTTQFVRLALPKMDLKADLDLQPILKSLGLEGDLAEGMQSLLLGSALPGPVVQSVAFKANEDGVEAAAASGAVGVRSIEVPERPLVIFDRPFEFYLMMPNTDTAVMAGIIRNPT